ncbi:MAG TPA: roadblock/LC7 domain-containing protein [Rugosimonospora sp.]|nr:roadblock/LC7 domain-containing protein [Rugosimonospora sp.]
MPLSAPAQDLQSTIDSFAASVAEVSAAALGTPDGLLITASDGLERDHADELAAVACGLVSIVAGSTNRIWGEDRVELAVAQLSQRVLMVKPCPGGAILAVVATSKVDIDAAGSAVEVVAQQVGRLLTPELCEELQQAQPM